MGHNCACLDEAQVKCSKPCKVLAWVSDKICDDSNNHCGCNWDGGDCCGFKNDYRYYLSCSCLDETFVHADAKCTKNCGVHQWKGDGKCDDVNNVCGCNWDGGDCCGKTVVKKFCKECKCLNPDKIGGKCLGKCAKPAYKGGTFCDDNNNNCGCGWDSGDCCGNVKKKYCKACKCLDPKNKKK